MQNLRYQYPGGGNTERYRSAGVRLEVITQLSGSWCEIRSNCDAKRLSHGSRATDQQKKHAENCDGAAHVQALVDSGDGVLARHQM